MFDYLQQFNSLPKELRDKVSSPEVMAIIADLEKKYQVDLASLIMKVMIKSLSLKSLPAYFMSDWQLGQNNSEKLTQELTEKVFSLVASHLGLAAQAPAALADQNIEDIVKTAGIVLPSSDLLNRFKMVIITYLRGVRSRVATRDTLAKEINLGGLKLSQEEITRILNICDNLNLTKAPESNHQGEASHKIINKEFFSAANSLDKIISAAEMHSRSGSEYNLRQAIASGQIKRPVSVAKESEKIKSLEAPDKIETIEAPDKIETIEAPDKIETIEAPDKVINLPLQKPQIQQPQNITSPIIPVTQKPTSAPVVAKSPASTPTPAQTIVKSPTSTPTPTPTPTLTKNPSSAPVAPVATSVIAPKKSLPLIQKLKTLFVHQKKVVKSDKTINPTQVSHLTKQTPVSQSTQSLKSAQVLQPIKPTQSTQATQSIRPTSTPTSTPTLIRPQAVAAARPAANPTTTSSRPSMHDVKPMTRVMGPIEELQFLDLTNFRRLGKTPTEISTKIFNKIKLLEAEGYEKMVAGVRAWRQSPVNRLYLKMMQEAISQGKTIKDLALNAQNNPDKYLKLEEIEEIIKMNSKLSF